MINSYFDIVNEMINADEHAQLIECATAFIEAQDEICNVHAYELNQFTIDFETDGFLYTVKGNIENGKIVFSAFYRKSDVIDDNIAVNYLSYEGFENALKTRNIYNLAVNKALRLIDNYNK